MTESKQESAAPLSADELEDYRYWLTDENDLRPQARKDVGRILDAYESVVRERDELREKLTEDRVRLTREADAMRIARDDNAAAHAKECREVEWLREENEQLRSRIALAVPRLNRRLDEDPEGH